MKYIDAKLLRKDIDNWKEAMADAVGEYSDGVRFALEHFTFVLDSLQQEQPEVDLENEIDAYYKEWDGNCRYAQTARHFAKWGAEHLADASKMISEDLEDCLELNEAAEEFARLYDNGTCDGIAQDCFKAGAEWQKDKDTEAVIVAEDRGFLKGADWARAKMMEVAVEADVITYEDLADGESDEERWVEFLVGRMPTNNLGDKVKIIILPKEGEK